MRIIPVLVPAAAALLLAGCGSEVSAPSLMPRAVEKQPIDLPAKEAREPAVPADATLRAVLARQIAAAEAGDRAFAEQRAIAEAAVARGAGSGQGSEAWVRAQQALTVLETNRVAVRDAAAAIDALRIDPANASPGNRAAIEDISARIAEIERSEAEAVAALAARLG